MGIVERKEREKAERRRSILEAAKELIKEKTFEEITMEDLATRLELSRATLYLYFRNKAEIYLTLLTEGMDELQEGYKKTLEQQKVSEPMDKLRSMAFVFFNFYAFNHSYFDLIVTKRAELTRESSDEVREAFEAAGDAVIRPLINVYNEGKEGGSFPEVPAEKMAYLLRAVGIGFAVGFREGNLKFPEDIKVAEQLLLYGLYGPGK